MEEMMLQIPFSKVMELVRQEDKMKYQKFLAQNLNQATADMLDQCVLDESEVLKMFTVK
jgi:hypothetical protein